MAFHLCELTHEALTCRHLWTFCHNDCIWSYSFQYLFWWHCGIYCNIKILRISCVLACISPIYHKRSIQMTSFSCLITVTKINSQETLLEIGFSFTVLIRSFKLVHPTMTGENMAGNSLGCCSLCYCHIWLLFFYLYFFSFCRNFGGNKCVVRYMKWKAGILAAYFGITSGE